MIWNLVSGPLPATLSVNYETEMSYPCLLWLKDDTFCKGWMVRELDKRNGDVIRWVSDVDVTRLVTHWTQDVEKPSANTIKLFKCKKQMIKDGLDLIPKSCPTCGIGTCKYDVSTKT